MTQRLQLFLMIFFLAALLIVISLVVFASPHYPRLQGLLLVLILLWIISLFLSVRMVTSLANPLRRFAKMAKKTRVDRFGLTVPDNKNQGRNDFRAWSNFFLEIDQTLAAQEAKLFQLKEELKIILESMEAMIIIVSPEETIVSIFNPISCLLSEPMPVGKTVPNAFAPETWEMLKNHLETHRGPGKVEKFTFSLTLAKTEAARWYNVRVDSWKKSSGDPGEEIIVIRDVSNWEQALIQRQELQRQIAQSSKLATIGEMAAEIAHEINNPLMIVSGGLELIREIWKAEKQIPKELLDNLETGTNRIKNIVRGCGGFARPDEESLHPVRVHPLIHEAVGMLRSIYSNLGIVIRLDEQAGQDLVMSSRGRILQIFMNLLINARDALAHQQDSHIAIETVNTSQLLAIRISDNGPGIKADDWEKIFDNFYTTKPPEEGTGLGLGIVRSIVRAMGGSIKAGVSPQGGASFTILLPLAPKDADPETSPAPDPEIGTSDSKFSGKVLLVDDEPGIRMMLGRHLIHLGLEVVSTSSGEKALELLGPDFSCLITDLRMPGMSGEELIAQIRVRTPMLPILVITGEVSQEKLPLKNNPLSQQVDGWLEKPFGAKELANALSPILKNSQSAKTDQAKPQDF